MDRMKTIGFVYDLRSTYLAEGYSEEDVAEFDSESTIRELADALERLGYKVDQIGHGRNLCARLVKGDRWDLVFSIAEGLKGRSREAQVPGLLELYNQPYVFSDPLTCAVTLDKAVARKLVRAEGVAVPDGDVVKTVSDLSGLNLSFPMFVKPVAEGTGKGIDGKSQVANPEELKQTVDDLICRFNQPVLVETYVPGREFTTGLLGTGSDASVLGTLEVRILDSAPEKDYSFLVKEQCESYVEYVPVRGGELVADVEHLALAAYKALECRDAGRVDIRIGADGKPYFMELNPLPGLHPTHSDLPMIATGVGLSYENLIGTIIESAMKRVTE